MDALSFLDREHTVAKPGYNRWLIPPAALAIHLCIGQVYATSVYKTAPGRALPHEPQTSSGRDLLTVEIYASASW